MCNVKRRRCANAEGETMDTSTQSSYEKLNERNEAQLQVLGRVLLSLQLTQHELEVSGKELQDAQSKKVELAAELEVVRMQLQQESKRSEDIIKNMTDENAKLKRSLGLSRLHIDVLKASIIKGSDAYDGMLAKVGVLEENVEELKKAQANAQANENSIRKATERSLRRHFGWCKATADPVLFRAAAGFWEGCATFLDDGDGKTSAKLCKDIWLQLTSCGFKGKLMNELEHAIKKRTRFDVIQLARRSDVNCQFNATAVGAVSQCQEGIKKYERGILCSDTTLRRTQKRVLNLAKSLGFSSFPTVEEGKVWCWGDEHGEFMTAVNRYVYEIYVKARCALVTKDKPWLVALSGDLVRVTTRGKSMTICGPKLVDSRLTCQQATGKTSNQSRNLYTPAVAGYVDEAYLMKYFDRLVDCFRVIEEQGYCVVHNERHEVFIDVLVVADMAYLHKYLRRGGGSHSCTHFCFLCSISSKYRQEGYPGGCRKCRANDIVYDSGTSAQKCRHHDVCDRDFLEWQSARLDYLEHNVKPRIPESCRRYYECLQSLREICLTRCRTPTEIKEVTNKKSYAALEKWLHAENRTREGCDLSCNIHTGIRICPLSLVGEDLRLRGVDHSGMPEIMQREALELLLREEEEYMKLRMYVADNRFRDLLNEPGHRSELHKTIIDMLHCPMRTNEKVLNLLYEDIMQGAHKAETKEPLASLTEALRRIGDLPPSFGHKFEKKNTKVLEKIKLPYDQSRKIFGVHQLHNLRELVHIAVPESDQQRREDWMTFLYHYVQVNEKLHSTLEYTDADITELEKNIDFMYSYLVTSIGGAENGVTNYFHYLGAGHVVWMIKRYGNLWRFCNESVESFNSLASRRYNGFNNKGGHKSSCKNEAQKKVLPYEVLGNWLARLSMWHIGAADTMFAIESTPNIVWKPETSAYALCEECLPEDGYDSDWTPIDLSHETSSDESDFVRDECPSQLSDSDDMDWCSTVPTLPTWHIKEELGTKVSKRIKYQMKPLVM